jgi:hypothetical protein
MAQVVSRRPLTMEAHVGACGICGGQTGTGFPPSSLVFPVNFNAPWLSILICHLGDEH